MTKRVGFGRINGPFGVPEKPEFSVGLDAALSKVKMELLNGPKSIFVLTGFGGSGKTTLATLLCWDEQIKSKSNSFLFSTLINKLTTSHIVTKTRKKCSYQKSAKHHMILI